MIVLAVVSLVGCALFSDQEASRTPETVWRSTEQHIRLEGQRSQRGRPTIPNAHPVRLNPDDIRDALASLFVVYEEVEEPIPVFTGRELGVVSDKIAAGLRRARPDQDIVFVTVGSHNIPGRHKSVLGLALGLGEDRVTTGRVFYRDGRLNLIFGLVLEDTEPGEKRRKLSYEPGRRRSPMDHDWKLMTLPGRPVYLVQADRRDDWLAFDIGSIAVAPPARTPASPVRSGAASPGPSVKERLARLENLRRQGLISEQEYKTLRREILNSL